MLRRFVAVSIAIAGFALTAEAPPQLQTRAAAFSQDASAYARLEGVTEAEALRRLTIQQASIAATDALAAEFADRLAGIIIQHRPNYRFLVHLTGLEPVAPRSLQFDGSSMSVEFVPAPRLQNKWLWPR